jgi:hypothetical protein
MSKSFTPLKRYLCVSSHSAQELTLDEDGGFEVVGFDDVVEE